MWWSALAALLCAILVVHGAPGLSPGETLHLLVIGVYTYAMLAVDDGCSGEDGHVRLVSGSDYNNFTVVLGGELGDVHGLLELCEGDTWKRPCLIAADGATEHWSASETAVACREMGRTRAGELRMGCIMPAQSLIWLWLCLPSASFGFASQTVDSNRRLSYLPQCLGSEEMLSDCNTSNIDTQNNCSPVVISCWNSSALSSQPVPRPTTAISLHSPSPSPPSSCSEQCQNENNPGTV